MSSLGLFSAEEVYDMAILTERNGRAFYEAAAAAATTERVAKLMHNLAEAEKLCERVGVIRAGRLLTVGSPDTLRLSQGGARLEVAGRGFTPEILARLGQRPEVAGVEQIDQHLAIRLNPGADSAPLVPFLAGLGVLLIILAIIMIWRLVDLFKRKGRWSDEVSQDLDKEVKS